MVKTAFPLKKLRSLEELQVRYLAVYISCAPDSRSENVIVKAIIIPELELCNVKWHVFAADLVERADDAAFEDAPEALNRLSVNRADDVLMLGMVNGAVVEFIAKVPVINPLIGAEQTDFFRDGFVNESLQGNLLHVLNDASYDVALAGHRASEIVLPEAVGPGLPSRLYQCRFLALPPTNVSSTSTIPPNLVSGSISAARILWHMECAVS
jgi:hypothetical protein